MTYNIDEYSCAETLCEGTPENYLVGLTKPTVDKILESENPADSWLSTHFTAMCQSGRVTIPSMPSRIIV